MNLFFFCLLRIFISQLGVALGFVLPPLLVGNHEDLTLVGKDLQLMFYLIAGFTSVLVVLVLFCKCKYVSCVDSENTKMMKLKIPFE